MRMMSMTRTKKLLLFLLLIPHLVIAEEFILLCKGIQQNLHDNSGNLSSYQNEYSIKVFDDSMRVITSSNKWETYVNDRFNINNVEAVKVYEKTKDSIYGMRDITYNTYNKRYEYSKVEINRITGDISYWQERLTKATDENEEKSYSMTFTGKCKKKERTF